MGDRPGSPSRVCMSEDKVCRKDMCWSLRIFLGPRELPGVGEPGLGEGSRYKWYQGRTCPHTPPHATPDRVGIPCARSLMVHDACTPAPPLAAEDPSRFFVSRHAGSPLCCHACCSWLKATPLAATSTAGAGFQPPYS
jgi:hypothetical protein